MNRANRRKRMALSYGLDGPCGFHLMMMMSRVMALMVVGGRAFVTILWWPPIAACPAPPFVHLSSIIQWRWFDKTWMVIWLPPAGLKVSLGIMGIYIVGIVQALKGVGFWVYSNPAFNLPRIVHLNWLVWDLGSMLGADLVRLGECFEPWSGA